MSDQVLAIAFQRPYVPPPPEDDLVKRLKGLNTDEAAETSATAEGEAAASTSAPEKKAPEDALAKTGYGSNHLRLAIVGDSLVRLCVSEYLLLKNPNLPPAAMQ